MPDIKPKAEDYAFQMVLSGAESFIEDDMDEDEELNDEQQHRLSIEFGYALLKAIRENRAILVSFARDHYRDKA